MKLYDVYPLYDINVVRGKGCKVWDENGQEYLDLYGGHAVISIGHCNSHYVEALTEQLNRLGREQASGGACRTSWQGVRI